MISTTEHATHSAGQQCKRSDNHNAAQVITPVAPGVIDFCSGLGGLSLAAKKLGLQIIAGVDVNLSASKTFSKNFPASVAMQGSVRSKTILADCSKFVAQFKAANQPVIVLSGPPCQGFSAAGSRNPTDPRNDRTAYIKWVDEGEITANS